MITFQDLYEQAQANVGDTSTDSLSLIKSDINQGLKIFRNTLKRPYTRLSKSADLTASQQYYQLPEDAVRIREVRATNGNMMFPLKEIRSEYMWNSMNVVNANTIAVPTYFFVRGNDEIGLWPIPGQTITNGLEISYEPRKPEFLADDYETGTITVTNGSTTITHSGTGFTPNMVGRYFQTTDGTDGLWYRIASYDTTSTLILENYYQGLSGSGKTFRIGQVADIPEEYHLSLVDYASYRYYLRRKDKAIAGEFKGLFDSQIKDAKQNYASKTSGVVYNAVDKRMINIFNIPPNTMS
jgi:hypothetical protein